MATNEIQNGCESSIEAVLASNHKRRCVLKPLSESLAMESCFLCVGSEMKGGLRSESRHRGGEGCRRREKLMRDLSFRSQYLMHRVERGAGPKRAAAR